MYLLDANAFMEASWLYYAFDLAPGFWTWLENPLLGEQVASVEAIKVEITAGNGDLVDWANALRSDFWWQDNADTVDAMMRLARWATGSRDRCAAFGVAVVDPFSAYRALGLRLAA